MRVVEVYAGAYASGKSETSINRARQYAAMKKNITLVDLDTVEPAYTLRPIIKDLENMGINVITQPDNFGLGEAASYVTSAQTNCLANTGDIIIDVNGIDKEVNLQIYLVVNTAKFETSTVDNIVEYVTFSEGIEKRDWKKFSGFISNTHFGDDTQVDDIVNGYQKLKKASEIVNIPIRAIGVDEKLASNFDLTFDNTEVWTYKRMMPKAFW